MTKHIANSIKIAIVDIWSPEVVTSIFVLRQVCRKSMFSLHVVHIFDVASIVVVVALEFVLYSLFDFCIDCSREKPAFLPF
jgi:hypothetical protein